MLVQVQVLSPAFVKRISPATKMGSVVRICRMALDRRCDPLFYDAIAHFLLEAYRIK